MLRSTGMVDRDSGWLTDRKCTRLDTTSRLATANTAGAAVSPMCYKTSGIVARRMAIDRFGLPRRRPPRRMLQGHRCCPMTPPPARGSRWPSSQLRQTESLYSRGWPVFVSDQSTYVVGKVPVVNNKVTHSRRRLLAPCRARARLAPQLSQLFRLGGWASLQALHQLPTQHTQLCPEG